MQVLIPLFYGVLGVVLGALFTCWRLGKPYGGTVGAIKVLGGGGPGPEEGGGGGSP
jgi:hypothetical protein